LAPHATYQYLQGDVTQCTTPPLTDLQPEVAALNSIARQVASVQMLRKYSMDQEMQLEQSLHLEIKAEVMLQDHL